MKSISYILNNLDEEAEAIGQWCKENCPNENNIDECEKMCDDLKKARNL